MRAPVSGGVGDVEIKLPIRVAPRRRGLGTALYQLLLAEVCLSPWPIVAMWLGSGPSASGALHRWSCERKCGTHFPCLLRRSASEAARNLWQTCSACAAWPRRRAGWIQRLKGSRVLVSTLIAPRSPLLAQAAWPIAALRALGLLRRQLLRNHSLRELSLLRNSSASQTRCCAPVSVPHTPLSQSVTAVNPREVLS